MELVREILESSFLFKDMSVEEDYIGQFSKMLGYNFIPIFRVVTLTLPSTSGSFVAL